jgi:hypothetical protein
MTDKEKEIWRKEERISQHLFNISNWTKILERRLSEYAINPNKKDLDACKIAISEIKYSKNEICALHRGIMNMLTE